MPIEGSGTRSRFYDGRPYARCLDPLLAGLHGFVVDQIEPGLRILEVGCGTGDMSFRLAGDAREVLGVELSPAMVAYADKRRTRESVDNVRFLNGDAVRVLADHGKDAFDIATMVLVLHEVPPQSRSALLHAVARVAKRLLCVDFRVPMPLNFAGLRNRLFEVAAGREHFGAFRDFNRRGGALAIAQRSGLRARHLRFVDGASIELCEIRR